MRDFVRGSVFFAASLTVVGIAVALNILLIGIFSNGGDQQETCTYTVTSEGYGNGTFTLALNSECGEMLVKIDENYFKDINYTLGHD